MSTVETIGTTNHNGRLVVSKGCARLTNGRKALKRDSAVLKETNKRLQSFGVKQLDRQS